jgi:hypothetical protein
MSQENRLQLLRLLMARLERLSVDSLWARRASGTRGSLLKALEAAENGEIPSPEQLDMLIARSFELLQRAAREIPDPEANLWRTIQKGK